MPCCGSFARPQSKSTSQSTRPALSSCSPPQTRYELCHATETETETETDIDTDTETQRHRDRDRDRDRESENLGWVGGKRIASGGVGDFNWQQQHFAHLTCLSLQTPLPLSLSFLFSFSLPCPVCLQGVVTSTASLLTALAAKDTTEYTACVAVAVNKLHRV